MNVFFPPEIDRRSLWKTAELKRAILPLHMLFSTCCNQNVKPIMNPTYFGQNPMLPPLAAFSCPSHQSKFSIDLLQRVIAIYRQQYSSLQLASCMYHQYTVDRIEAVSIDEEVRQGSIFIFFFFFFYFIGFVNIFYGFFPCAVYSIA